MVDRTRVIRFTIVFAAYVLTAWACLELPAKEGLLSPVWLPSGIVLALMLIWGRWIAVAVFAADLAVNLAINGLDVPVSLVLAIGDVADPLLVFYLLTRMGFRKELDRVVDVLGLFFAGATGAALSATVGTTALWADGQIVRGDFASSWLVYWTSVVLAYVLVTPFILAWRSMHLWRRIRPERAFEAVACAEFVALASAGAFLGENWQLAYMLLLFPIFIWATLRFGLRGATGSILLAAVIAIWGTVRETATLAGLSATETAQVLQSMLAAVIIGNLVMSIVIDDRDRARALAERTTESLRRAQELAHMGSWELHYSTGKITWTDELLRLLWPPAGDMTEVTIEQVISRVDSRDQPVVRSVIERAIEDRTGFDIEHRVADPMGAGALRMVSQSGVVLNDDAGNPDRIVVSVLDVTERASVRMLQDELISAASHDLRNPLTSICGFAETLCDGWDGLDEHERQSMIGIVHNEGVRMKELVDSALMQSRIDAGMLRGKVQAIPVLNVIRRSIDELQLDDIGVECPPELLVWGVAEQLETVFLHLLMNADRYGSRPISIEAVDVAEDAQRVTIAVIDSGTGVSTRFQPRMFSRFTRGPNASEGTGSGLGLSIVQGIVERSGGGVRYVRDDLGRTVFEVEIPMAPREAAATT